MYGYELKKMRDAGLAMRDSGEIDPELDRKHAERLKKILDINGWPEEPEDSEAAWLIAQHADHDVAFQEDCVVMMDEAGAEPVMIAYLMDRIAKSRDQEQLYGTQFVLTDEGLVPWKMDDREEVEQRRAEIGMQSLDQYEKELATRTEQLDN